MTPSMWLQVQFVHSNRGDPQYVSVALNTARLGAQASVEVGRHGQFTEV